MANRSMTLKELNARGVYLSECGRAGSVDQTVHARMLAAMREGGVSAAEAFRIVLSEDRDLGERYRRAHGKPLSLCEAPSDRNALADFISVDRTGVERGGAVRRGRWLGVEE